MSHYVVALKVMPLFVALLLSQVNASHFETKLGGQKVAQIVVTDIPYSFSPYANIPGRPVNTQYAHLFFDPLVRWGTDRKLQYRLLEKLEPLNNNTIRFHLKEHIYFHSGNPLTSQDVIWSFKAAQSNKYLQRKWQHNVTFTAINNSQFDIQTKLTPAQLLDYLSHLFILDSVYYTNNKIEHNVAQSTLPAPITTLPLSGTGPYRVSSFYAEINLRVQANLSYWGKQPDIKSLNFVKVKSPDSRLYALLADDIDISEAIPSHSINVVEPLDNKKIYEINQKNGLFLILNEKKNKFFKRESVRTAMHLAINQTGILRQILHGSGTIASTLEITTETIKQPVYDAKRSKYLIQQVEISKNLSLLVMEDGNMQTEEVTIALTNMFKRVGIKLEVTVVDTVTQWNKLQLESDFMLAAWHSPLINTNNLYQDIFENSYLTNYLQLLFKQYNKALTMQDKIRLFQQYQMTDRIVPLFSKNNIWAAHKQFDLQNVFSVNGLAYWHLLTTSD